MSLFLRRINIAGRFPFVRLIQILENPSYLLHLWRKNTRYKRERIDYSSRYHGIEFLSGQQTLVKLIQEHKSLGRFSDGEFETLTGGGIYPPDSDWSQRWSKQLEADLITVLSSTDSRLLIAVDPPSTFLAKIDSVHPIRFEYNMWVDMRRLMWKYLDKDIRYGHSHLFIKENCPDLDWGLLRQHFRHLDIIVATGKVEKLSHLRLGRNTYFLECGTCNAYEKKEAIKDSIRELIVKNNLDKSQTIVLASLGPTSQIIAFDFLDESIRVWDTGHMFEFAADNFIENVFNSAP